MTESRKGEAPEVIRERLRVFSVEVLNGAREQGIPTSPMATILIAQRKRRKERGESMREYIRFCALHNRMVEKIQRRIRHEASHEDVQRLIDAIAAEDTGVRFVMVSDADDLLQYMEIMEGDSMNWFFESDYVFVEMWYDFG